MKRILTIAIVVLCAATSAFSQTLTAADRDRALQYLESTKQGGAGGDRWSFRSAMELQTRA